TWPELHPVGRPGNAVIARLAPGSASYVTIWFYPESALHAEACVSMKWLIPGIWLASILFAHFRGRVRLRLTRQLLDQSVLLAPVNAFMVLCSRVPTTPYLPTREIPELQVLDDNWEVIREEALKMAELRRIKAAERHDDIGFNSFFKYGWKRFYLKWYDARHPSAEELCPRTVAILKGLPKVKAAMFAELSPGGKLNRHRDPFAGSLRYH